MSVLDERPRQHFLPIEKLPVVKLSENCRIERVPRGRVLALHENDFARTARDDVDTPIARKRREVRVVALSLEEGGTQRLESVGAQCRDRVARSQGLLGCGFSCLGVQGHGTRQVTRQACFVCLGHQETLRRRTPLFEQVVEPLIEGAELAPWILRNQAVDVDVA